MMKLYLAFFALLFSKEVIGSKNFTVHNYCATISSSTASGAQGYYALQIGNIPGQALHAYSLDMSASAADLTSCTDGSGNSYVNTALHSLWLLTDDSSSASCANNVAFTNPNNGQVYYVSAVGGHYDPFLACSTSSQYYIAQGQQGGGGQGQQQMNYCNMIKRIPAQQNQNNNNNNQNQNQMSYTYYCNSTGFHHQELYNTCEVGDISGKFGLASSTQRVFSSNDGSNGNVLVDPLPPLSGNFKAPMENSQPWSSVVFKCYQTPIACASFHLVTDVTTSPCADAFAAMASLTASEVSSSSVAASTPAGVSMEQYNAAIIASVILCLFGGLLLGGVGVYFWLKRSGGGEGPLLGGGAKSGDYARFA